MFLLLLLRIPCLLSSVQALLEECLSSSSEEVVKSTVARLPPHLVVVFLKDIVEKFEVCE